MPNLIPLTHFTKSAAITKRSLADGHFQRFSISVHETNGGDTRMDNKSLFSHYADVHEALFSWTFAAARSTWTFPCQWLTEMIRLWSAFAAPVGSRSGMVLPFTPRTRSTVRRLRHRQEERSAQEASELSTGKTLPKGSDKIPSEEEGS
jgi:hypothetical protein